MRRIVTILFVLIVVIGGSLYGYRAFATPEKPQTQDFETYTVSRGKLISTVSATGSIEPEAEVALSFRSPGRVEKVLVAAGQPVRAGQLLASLESTDQQLALEQAQANVEVSRARLAQLKKAADPEDLAAAQAAVESAQASVQSAQAMLESAQAAYRDLLRGPGEEQIRVQKANMERARVLMEQAQSAYDKIAHLPDAGMMPQAIQLQQATIDYEAAKAQFELTTAEPSEAQVAAALAQIAQAQASVAQAKSALVQAQNQLNRLLNGPDQEDIDIAEAQVRQAELSMRQAQIALERTQLRAPFDGVGKGVRLADGAFLFLPLADISGYANDSRHASIPAKNRGLGGRDPSDGTALRHNFLFHIDQRLPRADDALLILIRFAGRTLVKEVEVRLANRLGGIAESDALSLGPVYACEARFGVLEVDRIGN
ncbi:MAG TPA: biotin/lipoyl-binding protein, partial [Anaerolineae bacterium]|nr:biotin/lipoyl-binding protein [Anaerolineae bacterium]